MALRIDTYYDVTCDNCARSWSTDFNAKTGTMDGTGMGMETNKSYLSKSAHKNGWISKDGLTYCPECAKAFS